MTLFLETMWELFYYPSFGPYLKKNLVLNCIKWNVFTGILWEYMYN